MLREKSCILASCCLLLRTVLGKLRVTRLAVIQEEIAIVEHVVSE